MKRSSWLRLHRGSVRKKSTTRRFLKKRTLSLVVDLAFVGLVQLTLSMIAQSYLPQALSDDDFTRVVISQRWLNHLQPDPTGSSWLPFPFYLQGGFLWLTSPTLAAARSTALYSSVLAATILYLSARILGNSRSLALLTTTALMALPLSLWTSIATIPAYLTAALIALALSAASRRGLRFELISALSIFIATGSRYEAWPFALMISTLFIFRHYQTIRSKPYSLLPIGLASGFCVLWLAHGLFIHQDPFFFIQRVRDYKQALLPEANEVSLVQATIRVASLAWTYFPMACASLMLTGLIGAIAPLRRLFPSEFRQRQIIVLVLCSVLPLFLWLGELSDGTATQHPERAFISLGFLLPLVLSSFISHCPRPAIFAWSIFLVSGLGLQFIPVPNWFPQRQAEEKAGQYLATHVAADESILVATQDYGYFAIMAAAGHPERFKILKSSDPRERQDSKTIEEKILNNRAQQIRNQLEESEVNWAVVSPPLLNARAAGLQTAANWDGSSSVLSLYRIRAERNEPLGGKPSPLKP